MNLIKFIMKKTNQSRPKKTWLSFLRIKEKDTKHEMMPSMDVKYHVQLYNTYLQWQQCRKIRQRLVITEGKGGE